jgi:heme exporter protein A
MASWVLTAMDLACQKAQRTLFEGVSFSVPEGSWLHIEGGNGCGKTSLLRILCGLSPAARGQVLWSSSPGTQVSRPDRSVLHYIGHALGLKPDLTLAKTCARMPKSAAWRSAASRRCKRWLRKVSKAGLTCPCGCLSQGQRQGVALARLRTSPARIWILDEPLVGLDVHATATARDLLQSHVDAGGAVVMTSHHDVGLQGPGRGCSWTE